MNVLPRDYTKSETDVFYCAYVVFLKCVEPFKGETPIYFRYIKHMFADAKNSPTKDLMLLALKIIEHAVSNQEAMNTSVDLSLYIIEVILLQPPFTMYILLERVTWVFVLFRETPETLT